MKNNRAVNFDPFIEFYKIINYLVDTKDSFIRSGIVGGKQKIPLEFIKVFDEWEEKCLSKSELKF